MEKNMMIPLYVYPIMTNYALKKYLLYQITAHRKMEFTELEYAILTNPDDITMQLNFQYINFLMYHQFCPTTPNHFKRMNAILNQLESKVKATNKIKEKQLKKKKEK